VLVGDETARPYERPPLSKGYLLGRDPRDVAFVRDEMWYQDNRVELLLGVRATMLDPAAHVLTLDGFDPVPYDKLLITTGSRTVRLDVPGADLIGVRYLRTIIDADILLEHLVPGASVVVVGAGWIGLEVGAAAIEHGATVTVIERGTLPLQNVLGDEIAAIFARKHESKGVTFRKRAGVASFEGSGGSVTSVKLTDGTEIPATLVVVGIGIQPNVELATGAGLQVDNGIVTDAALRTSDPDIYACGDVSSTFNPLIGKHLRLDHWANALNSGPAAAKSMLGQAITYDEVPYFYSDQFDLSMEYAGHLSPGEYDRVVYRGDPATYEFLAFWVKDGRVLAGMNANIYDVQDDIQKLVRAGYAGKQVDLAKLADPAVPLAALLT
jgi:3-phenylpropionate/trans-cinnamate dioxygenase ferredoxin reductase component